MNIYEFNLVSLFNGLSNFVGYLMAKPSLEKNSSNTIQYIDAQRASYVSPRVSRK